MKSIILNQVGGRCDLTCDVAVLTARIESCYEEGAWTVGVAASSSGIPASPAVERGRAMWASN